MNLDLLASMHSGCEDLDAGIVSSDSIYAAALMGGEGFTDTIKKGAKATIAWIKQLLNNILDAILFWFGGRDNVKSKLNKLKNSKVFSMFKSDITNKVEKVTLPAVKIANRFVNEVIEGEYQEFFKKNLKETSEITSFFVAVNKLTDNLAAFIKAAEAKPSEDHLDLEPQLVELRKCIEAGRKLVNAIDKQEEPNQDVIKNLNSAVSKLAKATNVLTGAQKTVSKGLDELSKEAESKAVYTPAIQSAIDSGSINRVRASITALMDDNRISADQLNDIIAHLEKDFPNLYVEYQETTLARELAPKADWSADTYDTQGSYTYTNFSKKRVHHLRDMRNYLRENKVKGFY